MYAKDRVRVPHMKVMLIKDADLPDIGTNQRGEFGSAAAEE